MSTMTADALVECQICKRKGDPTQMAGVMVLVAGKEERAFAHRDCFDRYNTKVARTMYKHRDPADIRKSFEDWRNATGY